MIKIYLKTTKKKHEQFHFYFVYLVVKNHTKKKHTHKQFIERKQSYKVKYKQSINFIYLNYESKYE